MTQEMQVYEYCRKHGSITSMEAFKEFGITRLSAKIYNLKQQGFKVLGTYEQKRNRQGNLVNYKRYCVFDTNAHKKHKRQLVIRGVKQRKSCKNRRN